MGFFRPVLMKMYNSVLRDKKLPHIIDTMVLTMAVTYRTTPLRGLTCSLADTNRVVSNICRGSHEDLTSTFTGIGAIICIGQADMIETVGG